MKIFVTTPTWSLNGVNLFSAHLVRALRRAGVAAHLLVTHPQRPDPKPLPRPGDVPLERLGVAPLGGWRTRWRTLVDYLERHAPCLYLPNHDFRHSVVCARLSARVGIIGIVHSDDPQHYDHVARLGRYWNAVVAVSQTIAARTAALDVPGAPRPMTIPYGVPVSDYPSRQEAPASNALRIMYTGRLEQAQKRVLDLPTIGAALAARAIPFELTVAGDGSCRTALERRVRALGLQGHVRFTGTLGHDQLLDLLTGQDVLLLPSAFEGLPLSLLEAMSRGCVPVVSDIPSGIPEVIRDGITGYRVPVGDTDTFAERLAYLQRYPDRRHTMSRNAYDAISRGGYRLEDMVRRYMDLFHHVWDEVTHGSYHRTPGPLVLPAELTCKERLFAPIWTVTGPLLGRG